MVFILSNYYHYLDLLNICYENEPNLPSLHDSILTNSSNSSGGGNVCQGYISSRTRCAKTLKPSSQLVCTTATCKRFFEWGQVNC